MIPPAPPYRQPGYPLGTDELGRDMLARLIMAGRLSRCRILPGDPGPSAIGIRSASCTAMSAASSHRDHAHHRSVSIISLGAAEIAISGALGAGIVNSIVSLTIVFVPRSPVAESVTTGVRNMDFVEAERASGAGPFTIMRVHMLGQRIGADLRLCHG